MLRVGAIGAYNKQIKLNISEEDLAKIEIRYSDGSFVDIENDILPNNITIYIKAIANELGEVSGTATLHAFAYVTLDTDNLISSTLNMSLSKGAEDLQLTSAENISIEYGDEAIITFESLPNGSSLGVVSLVEITKGIISATKNNATQFTIQGIKVGNTRITLVSANGINRKY